MRTLLSFIAILLLVTSGFPIGFADTTPTDSSTKESIEAPVIQSRKIISISLEEAVAISSGPTKKKQIENTHNSVNIWNDSSLKFINLNEDLTLRTTTTDQFIYLDLIVAQPQTIIERISQQDKIRDDRKKNSKIDLSYLDDSNQHESLNNLISFDSNILKTSLFTDPLKLISDPIIEQNFENNLESINIFENESFENIFVYVNLFDSSFLFDNSFVILIFTPLAFFLFIFSEDVKFKIEKIRPVLSFALVFIILSTVVLTPYSISSSYWPEAYADTGDMNETIFDNTTASIDDTSSSSTPAEDTSASEATTSNTDTSVDSASSSSTPAEDSESTEVSSSTNATLTVIPVNGTNSTGTISEPITIPNAQNHGHLTLKSTDLAL